MDECFHQPLSIFIFDHLAQGVDTGHRHKGAMMQVAALVFSVIALLASVLTVRRQLTLARHANSIPVLVDLLKEHRGERLAKARKFVNLELLNHDLSQGFSGIPEQERRLVRDLTWFYDQLGLLVFFRIIDIEPISGYIGGSITRAWEELYPLIKIEREKRRIPGKPGSDRSLEYFEVLYDLIQKYPAVKAHVRRRSWRDEIFRR